MTIWKHPKDTRHKQSQNQGATQQFQENAARSMCRRFTDALSFRTFFSTFCAELCVVPQFFAALYAIFHKATLSWCKSPYCVTVTYLFRILLEKNYYTIVRRIHCINKRCPIIPFRIAGSLWFFSFLNSAMPLSFYQTECFSCSFFPFISYLKSGNRYVTLLTFFFLFLTFTL